MRRIISTAQARSRSSIMSRRGASADSVYTASRALLLPSLARELKGEVAGDHGWLMSVPNHHQLIWHVVHDASVLRAVRAMARFTDLGHSNSPGPVNPHLSWWYGEGYEQLTHMAADGALTIEVSPRFGLSRSLPTSRSTRNALGTPAPVPRGCGRGPGAPGLGARRPDQSPVQRARRTCR